MRGRRKKEENSEDNFKKACRSMKEYFHQLYALMESNLRTTKLIMEELKKFEDTMIKVEKCPRMKI